MNIFQRILWKISKKYRVNKWKLLQDEYREMEIDLGRYLKIEED